ncbi:hypothetical protein HFN76_18210 [Rhizobium laguerreae]|uniref:hypothetical protein n=1 Tax=Rhizobium laguerreae TaxID=1076926 RepID=UPI001C908635|nr:hypothetical protein [Rhizobium laguerreae]MBY3514150.1 hypothetical protein [Rhizobium laguerreae]
MADIDAKAQALSAARHRILQLQEQMADKVLQMAAEVEKLMDVVPLSEAKAFLKARCNLPVVELSTYVGFAKTLKGSEDVLREARVSFPVVKALVSADPDARREILERLEIGAQIDTKDVASIRRRLVAAKLTAAEALTAMGLALVSALKGLEIDWGTMMDGSPPPRREFVTAPPPLDSNAEVAVLDHFHEIEAQT